MSMTNLYLITNHTNLHVGAGSSNQGVIDNLVQRDPVDQLPLINSSSLKGSLREYFEEVIEKDKDKGKKTISDKIFGGGSNKDDSNTKKESKKGCYIFHDGIILSYPVRSNKEPFFNAFSTMVIERFLESIDLNIFTLDEKVKNKLLELMKLNPQTGAPLIFNYADINNLKIEEFSSFVPKEDKTDEFKILQKIFGDRLVLFSKEDFISLTDDYNLPVIARNQLENGESKNLFYEQVVPRQARFYSFITNNDTNQSDLESNLSDKVAIQVGANGSIGYGLCKFLHLNGLLNPKSSK